MVDYLVWVSGAAGLVTMGVFFRHILRRHSTNIKDYLNLDKPIETYDHQLGKTTRMLKLGDIYEMVARDRIEGVYRGESSDWLSEEELRKYRKLWQLLTREKHVVSISKRLRRPPAPRGFRLLGRYLPKELEDHREELLQYLEDGLADRASKKQKQFLRSETFNLGFFIGKTRLFKFSKSWRRTIR